MTERAEAYPHVGAVIVVRHFESPGPTGWYRNEHNKADGWYWFRSERMPNTGTKGPVKRRRDEAMADAERFFSNITGWATTGRHSFHAKVES